MVQFQVAFTLIVKGAAKLKTIAALEQFVPGELLG